MGYHERGSNDRSIRTRRLRRQLRPAARRVVAVQGPAGSAPGGRCRLVRGRPGPAVGSLLPGRPLVGATATMPVPGARNSLAPASPRPRWRSCWANIFSAIGDQRDVAHTNECDVQRIERQRLPRLVGTWRRGVTTVVVLSIKSARQPQPTTTVSMPCAPPRRRRGCGRRPSPTARVAAA